MPKLLEKDLYAPIARYFTSLDYDVYGEVLDCDLVGVKDEQLIIVELKLNFNITLIHQGVDRFKYSDLIYLGFVKPKHFTRKQVNKTKKLAKMLGVGIILVDFKEDVPTISILCTPNNIHQIKATKKKKMLTALNETNVNINTGGVTQVKINTPYKEKCVYIACIMTRLNCVSAKILCNEYDFDKNVSSLLRNNYYGWFTKISRGLYTLNDVGFEALDQEEYLELVYYYQKKLDTLL